jgi:predicted dehydrogenase
VLGVMDCSFLAGPTMQQWLGVSGTNGHLSVAFPFRQDDDTPVITVERRDRGAPAERERHEVERAYSYHLMVEHFVGAVLGRHALAYTLQDSLAQMRTIDALREAASTGKRVALAS